MSERLSPLTQRVRRLIGTGSLAPLERGEPSRPHGHSATASLFEARIARLSHTLEKLRAVDLQREDELRDRREQIQLARHRRA